ncbi:PEP/pyruvate-binding domain-containing protein [Microlunatus soli]|uniref:Pyruvate, water dikinase n=1 Tax=Microlunatus soli TaxID=630515 RepID=A0A1H1ZFS9_9ACTN|nr:PEP/pyruvate-binding domain-containing protein [Microlunatus soli]SDT32352.1 pyruvate, water dikinase [Microlunatus soli]
MNQRAAEVAIRPLGSVGAGDLATAGGKAANLGELIGIGMPVPDGFVITTDAYRRLAESAAELTPQPSGSPAGLQNAWAGAVIPDDLRTEIVDAYRSSGGGRVAVRSSATAEDLPGAAFAGQQDTYLDIDGDEALLDAVRRCWASLWTERAIAYRDRLGIAPDDVTIAVVVQQMAPASVAGVMFTADPVSGERDRVIIDAAPGLGEAVVSGLVTPDHYRLGTDGTVLEHRSGERGTVVGAATTAAADGELLPAELRRLAELGGRVAAHYRRPMDIEWAIVRAASADHHTVDAGSGGRAGDVRLLQARPMTGLPSEPVELTPLQRRTNQVVLDYLPIRPYPLDLTTWTQRGVAKMLADLAASIGIRLDLADAFVETDGVVSSFRPVDPHPTAATLRAPVSLARRIRRYHADAWRQDPRYRRFRRQLDDLGRRPASGLSWQGLLQRVEDALAAAQLITDLRVDYMPSAGAGMGRLLLISAVLGRRRQFDDLLTGAQTITTVINRRLSELAGAARATPDLMRHAEQLSGAELYTAVQHDSACGPFVAELEDFLADYGSRETDSLLVVSSPTWGDAPHRLLDLIMMLARTEDHASNLPDGVDHDRSTTSVQGLLGHPLLRSAFARHRVRRAVEAARAGVVVREDTHFELMRPAPLLRQALIEIGERMADAGVLAAAGDVWHLRLEEIRQLGAPEDAGAEQVATTRAAVEQRKAIRAGYGAAPLVNVIAPEPVGDALLVGSPASAGQVTGPVRIVRGPDDFGALRSGEVLVCPNTNPSWTPLFQRAIAVVADTGGAGSHAAIVAREYGIPAVMGTRNGTSRLTDGQRVTVDGDHGQVR